MTAKFLLTLTTLALLICQIACIDEVPAPSPDYKTFPLDLKKEELADGNIKLTWNKLSSFEFKEYWIGRTFDSDTVPYISEAPTLTTPAPQRFVEIIARIEASDSTRFIDSVTVFTRKTSYRIFGVMEKRVVSSQSVTVQAKVFATEVNNLGADDMLFVPEENKILITDRTQNQIHLVNPLNLLASTQTVFQFVPPEVELSYTPTASGLEVYVPLRNTSLTIRNMSQPAFATSRSCFLSLGTFTFSAQVIPDNDLATGINYWIATPLSTQTTQTDVRFFSVRRDNGQTMSSSLGVFIPPSSGIQFFFGKRINKLREAISFANFTGTNAHLISWTSAGVVSIQKSFNLPLGTLTAQPFTVAPDNQFFITNPSGLIFNKTNFQAAQSLAGLTGQTYRDFIFSEDGTRIYALRNPRNSRTNKQVDVFSYPNLRLERSLQYSTNPTRLFKIGNELILVGRSPNSTRNTLFERINL